LFFCIGDASPPLFDYFVLLTTTEGFHSFTRIPDLLALSLDRCLNLLEPLRQGQVLKEIENGETLKRRYGLVNVRE
jgi:hypothetical protein